MKFLRAFPGRVRNWTHSCWILCRGTRPIFFPIESFTLRYPSSRALLRASLRKPRVALWLLKSYEQMVERPLQENLLRRISASLLRSSDVVSPVVIDAGGWIGDNALPWANLVGGNGHIVMVEPSPRNLESVRELMKLNGLENVSLVPALLAAGDGSNFVPVGSIHHSEFVPAVPTDSQKDTIQSISIDSLSDGLGVVPTLIHLDVEGMELEALRGAERMLDSARPAIIFEWHIARQEFSPILALLKRYDYRVFLINEIPPKCAPDTRNFLAISADMDVPDLTESLLPHEGAQENRFPLTLGPPLLELS